MIFMVLLPLTVNVVMAQEAESREVSIHVNTIMEQEAESREVSIHVNTLMDHEAPAITILAPSMNIEDGYVSESKEVEVIGEVTDRSKIRFVSVNNDIRMADRSGLFASTLNLDLGENEVRVKSMDEHGNLQEVVFVIDYKPPVVTLADRIHDKSNYYGLIIGVNEYEDPKEIAEAFFSLEA